jgi:hypothetical protein
VVPLPRQNRSKTRSRSSTAIPGPRSATLTAPFGSTSITISLPGAVCVIAFSTRLRTAWLERVAISLDQDLPVGPLRCKGAFVRNGNRRQVGDHLLGEAAKIDLTRYIESDGVEPRHAQELLHEAVHPRDVRLEHRDIVACGELLDGAGQDREWSAQFVRRVGSEAALHGKSLFQPVERLVHRGDKRLHLARHVLHR